MNLAHELDKAMKSRFSLWLFNRIMWNVVPFNKPHNIRIINIEVSSLSIELPYKRKNFNHIKGIHACALATLSEYITGLSLLRWLNTKDYRLIMKSIKMDYLYQAKQTVTAKFTLEKDSLMEKIEGGLSKNDSVVIPLSVKIYDLEKNNICIGNIEWQIKPWKKVKTKV